MGRSLILVCALSIASFAGPLVPGDATLGAKVFRELRCIACHSIRGEGGASAPDLGRMLGRAYTPAYMASLMWNHAPAMWSAMDRRGIAKPRLAEAQAADLFAYFHSTRAFEKPGDAGRGKQVFTSKHCADCHGIDSQKADGGPPVTGWRSLAAPIVLAREMWNHASHMQDAMARRHLQWPRLTAQELTDLLVYLQNLPQTRGRTGEFALGGEGNGEALFQSKGCADCHQGRLSLQKRLATGSMNDFVAAMWNHSPGMRAYGSKIGRTPPQLEKDEMRQIVAYLWYAQLYAEPGSAKRGERIFAAKKCARCHNDPATGAPDLKRLRATRTDPLRPFSMVSVLWQHGPPMLEKMGQQGIPWPRFTGREMADLIEYLNKM